MKNNQIKLINYMKSHFKKIGIFNILFLTIGLFSIITFYSCDKDDSQQNNNDNYYIKYNIKAPSPYGRFSNWTASTPNGTYSNNGLQTSNWNQTYGPVNKGFTCKVQIGNYQGGTPTIEIHVSKNGDPFTLKTTMTGASASYVINF